jgi:AAA+ ATPase superfamily predicted ATPase
MKREEERMVFPSRVAVGENFCNRVEEKKRIFHNIKNTQHTLIVSPRRYGKTSLVCKTIEEAQVAFGYVHFFNAFRDEIVFKRFIEGLDQLLTQLLPKAKGAMHKFAGMIRHAKLSVNIIGAVQAEVKLQPISKNIVDSIKGLLEDIDKILCESGKLAVLFFDEFQDIVESDSSDELQAVMRDFAQFTQHITFIISGSHRHMLLKIFDDSNKPFYKLFDRIDLHRIKSDEYMSFIQMMAKKKWNKELNHDILREILELTECHAYYVNRLCFKLWSEELPPTLSGLSKNWEQLVEEEFGAIANDLSALTKNQRIILQMICKNARVREPTSDFFLKQVELSSRSVSLAISALEKTDHIERVEEGYRAIDPVAKYILSK